MKNPAVTLALQTTPEQAASLLALQTAFAELCNAIAPVVAQTRCWNRVTLHHWMYRSLRERFPQIGSQMVCNAIYSVSRTSRLLFQSPRSPLNIQKLGARPLPTLKFLPSAPVYFDRHTLSLKHGAISMYTMEGRMRFDARLQPEQEALFANTKLQEIVLRSTAADRFVLSFSFMQPADVTQVDDPAIDQSQQAQLPEYILLVDDEASTQTAGTVPVPGMASPPIHNTPLGNVN